MHIIINKSNCIIKISHNHAEGDGKKEADLSNFGKLDTVRLMAKRTVYKTVLQVIKWFSTGV